MKKVLQISTLLIFVTSFLISILDLFGFLSIITNKVPYITLILLSVLGAYLITEKTTKIDSIDKKVEKGFEEIFKHHHIPEIQRFDSLVDFYNHIILSFKEVKSIHDVSWSNPQKFNNQEITKNEEKAYERFKSHKEKILKKGKIVYNEIFTFPYESRKERAFDLVKKGYKSYNAVYYQTNEHDKIPRISFIILEYKNHKELLTFFYKNNSEIEEKRLFIKSEDIIDLFKDYYDNAFNNGTPLKLGDKINYKEIKKIEKTKANTLYK